MKILDVWTYRPQLLRPEFDPKSWKSLVPFMRGADERDRHTLVIGYLWTGRVVIAYYQCSGGSECPWSRYRQRS